MAQLLRNLLGQIEDHAAQRNAAPRLVFLGDLIDRGAENIEVMDIVHNCLSEYNASRLILGNHDEYLLKFLNGTLDADARNLWLTYGGRETFRSYGLDPDGDDQEGAASIRKRFPHHYQMLCDAAPSVELEDFFLVHAGVRPGVALHAQTPRDLRWIREPFLSCKEPFEKIIIHGHTITTSGHAEVFSNRIAIDTGAYANGRLTAAALPSQDAQKNKPVEFITANSL